MRMKLVLSVFVVILVLAAAFGATMAYFTDTAVTNPVAFQAGILEVDIDDLDDFDIKQSDDRASADLNKLNPGDKWGWEFRVCNTGTKTFHSALYICSQDIIGQMNQALEDANSGMLQALRDKGFGDDELSDVIVWKLYQNSTSTEPIFEGKMDGSPMLIELKTTDVYVIVQPKECIDFILVAELPKDAGNGYQGSKMDLVVGVLAWQTTNNAPELDVTDVDCKLPEPYIPADQ